MRTAALIYINTMDSKCRNTLVHKLKTTGSCKAFFGGNKSPPHPFVVRAACPKEVSRKRKTEWSSLEKSVKHLSVQDQQPETTKCTDKKTRIKNSKALPKKNVGQELVTKLGAKTTFTQHKDQNMNYTNEPTWLTHSSELEPFFGNKKQQRLVRHTQHVTRLQMQGKQHNNFESASQHRMSGNRCVSKSREKKSKVSKAFGVLINKIKKNQKTMVTALSEPRSLPKTKPKEPKKKKKKNQKNMKIVIATPEHLFKQNIRSSNFVQYPSLKCPEIIAHIIESKDQRLMTMNNSRHLSIIKQAIRSPCRISGLFKLQTQVNAKMRAVLVDWMFRIASQMGMQRQTVYLAITILDQYTQIAQILKRQYQLFALAGFLIAYKQQYSSHDQFLTVLVTSSDGGYSRDDILEAQRKLALRLKFKLNPTTFNFWMEYFTMRWDRFIEKGHYLNLEEIGQCKRLKEKPILFRQPCPQAYNLYRQVTQLIDTTLFCDKTVSDFDRPKLVMAGIYLILRAEIEFEVKFERMLVESDCSKFQNLSEAFLEKMSPIFRDRLGFNEIFNQYLIELCDFELADIIPEIKFVAGYLKISFGYELPETVSCSEMTYEQFIRFQVYPQSSLQFVLARL